MNDIRNNDKSKMEREHWASRKAYSDWRIEDDSTEEKSHHSKEELEEEGTEMVWVWEWVWKHLFYILSLRNM